MERKDIIFLLLALFFSFTFSLVLAQHAEQNRLDFNYFDVQIGEDKIHTRDNVFVKPAIIPMGAGSQNLNQIYNVYSYIFRQINPRTSSYVMYPYSFSHKEPNETITADGAFVDVNPPEGISAPGYFQYFRLQNDIDLGRARALYLTDVAVLRIQGYHEDNFKDYTFESDYYCTALATYLGKYTQCFSSLQYLNYRGGRSSSFVFLNETDVISGILNIGTIGVLIIPDIIAGTESLIQEKFGQTGVDQIKQFINNGGVIYASSKSALLLERWGIIASGTINSNYVLATTENKVIVKGCEDTSGTDYSSFVKSAMCFGVPVDAEGNRTNYLLSSYLFNKDQDTQLKPLIFFDQEKTPTLRRRSTSTGLSETLPTNSFLPMVLFKQVGKGQLLINNANSAFNVEFYPWFFNALFLGFSREYILDANVIGEPIPALEANVVTGAHLTFMNLFDDEITPLVVNVWIPKGISVTSFPSECTYHVVQNVNDTSVDPNLIAPPPADGSIDKTACYLCNFASINAFARQPLNFDLEIVDSSATAARYNVLLLYPLLKIVNARTSKEEIYDNGGIRVNAMAAPLLRAAYNPDPSSFYPLKGEGVYIDNILTVENKEDTEGTDVEHIAIVPIVSPAVDGDDQTDVCTTLEYWNEYYTSGVNKYQNYPFPFRAASEYDYLDYQFLSNKKVMLAADWDTPVKITKEDRDSRFPTVENGTTLDIGLKDYSTTIDNPNVVVKQQHYPDSDIFYEHATQRQLVFIDTSYEEGAAAKYPSGIPSERQNPNRIKECKVQTAWVRNDIYFYKAYYANYPMPDGMNDTRAVISIDRYPPYTGECVPGSGNARAVKLNPGYFDDTKPGGLKPNEYSNELLMNCEKVKVDYDTIETYSGGKVTKIHYLMPVVNPRVKKASDLMDFDPVTGEYKDYPEVKFIYAHTASFLLYPNITRYGGMLEFTFPAGVNFINTDPVANNDITYSADHVAFVKTVWDGVNRVLKAYFKRGNMPDEQFGQPSVISVNFENLNTQTAFTFDNFRIYEMKYDLNLPAQNYERYSIVHTQTNLTAEYIPHFSLPAIKLRFRLKRTITTENENGTTTTEQSASIYPYELLEPFVRYGVYEQELLGHRTVWGSLETHHVSDPGLTTVNGGFSTLSHIGISSIPFREFLTTGSAQLIPAASETGRIEWNDPWGRRWVQPVRSIFPDVPPIPPPLRNFMMTTTFEVTNPTTGERLMEWNSDEPVDVYVQLKLLNNYPKYFEIGTCKKNEVLFAPDDKSVPSRIFDYTDPYPGEIKNNNTSIRNAYFNLAHKSTYGECLQDLPITLEGRELTNEDVENIAILQYCNANEDLQKCRQLEQTFSGLPVVKRRNDSKPTVWNHITQVENYYPENYIKDNMWDLTHYDYDDNAFDKAYKYHMDNNLPNLDMGIIRPHNIIAQPIFKGFGYTLSYSNQNTAPRYPGKRGWWSDNLQNRDHTLLAGQTKSNDIAVGAADLLSPTQWISIDELTHLKESRLKAELGNIYTCLFNRHRAVVDPANTKTSYVNNVYQNNIVPVEPTLSKYDDRLYNFDCSNYPYQYSPDNISQYDNVLRTNNARDWLYFAANLRGNAKENINVIYKLLPSETGVKYEGFAKVNDGGRFVYWNPANGPNSFLIVDDPVNVVEAKRCDIEIEAEMFPKVVHTFNSAVYQLITFEDPEEANREFSLPTYINHYGFGDATISIYVGGVERSTAIIEPGSTTYATITFYNNAGFDWNLNATAITADEMDSIPISANDLLSRYKHTIRVPREYRFMTVHVPEEYKDYIHIVPSDHNAGVAPIFFDFENINVATIRDGFKGVYTYKITLSPDIPNNLRGKLWVIPIDINREFFDRLPGYNDPTNLANHDYSLRIPPIVIGVQNPLDHPVAEYAGKVFYTSGYSTNLAFQFTMPTLFVPEAAKIITDEEIIELRKIASQASITGGVYAALAKFFDELPSSTIKFTNTSTATTSRITFNDKTSLTALAKFPESINDAFNGNYSVPDRTRVHLLVKTTARQLPYGTNIAHQDGTMVYEDFSGKQKTALLPDGNIRTVFAKGAWLQVRFNGILVSSQSHLPLDEQVIFYGTSGTAKITLSLENVGSDVAYNVNLTLIVAPGIEIMKDLLTIPYVLANGPGGSKYLTLLTHYNLAPGDLLATEIFLTYSEDASKRYVTTSNKNLLNIVGGVHAQNPIGTCVFVQGAEGSIDLTPTPNEITVTQEIREIYGLPIIIDSNQNEVTLVGIETAGDTVSLYANIVRCQIRDRSLVRFKFYRRFLIEPYEGDAIPLSDTSSFPFWSAITDEVQLNATKDRPPVELLITVGGRARLLVQYKVELISSLSGHVLDESNTVVIEKVRNTPYLLYYALGSTGIFVTVVATFFLIGGIILLIVFLMKLLQKQRKEQEQQPAKPQEMQQTKPLPKRPLPNTPDQPADIEQQEEEPENPPEQSEDVVIKRKKKWAINTDYIIGGASGARPMKVDWNKSVPPSAPKILTKKKTDENAQETTVFVEEIVAQGPVGEDEEVVKEPTTKGKEPPKPPTRERDIDYTGVKQGMFKCCLPCNIL